MARGAWRAAVHGVLRPWGNRNRLTDLENEFKVTRRERLGRRIYYKFGIHIYTVVAVV